MHGGTAPAFCRLIQPLSFLCYVPFVPSVDKRLDEWVAPERLRREVTLSAAAVRHKGVGCVPCYSFLLVYNQLDVREFS